MAEAAAPRDIRLFEILQLVSILVGLLHQLAISDDSLIDALFVAGIMLSLTLLISRGRKGWARWLLAIMFLLGIMMMLWMWPLLFVQGYPILTAGVTILQAAAIALLFTKQSSHWLRSRPSPA